MKHWDPQLEDSRALPLSGLGRHKWESGWEPYRRPRLPWQEIGQAIAAVLFLAVALLAIRL